MNKNPLKRFKLALRNETGATALEYALLASLIAGVIIATVAIFGQDVLNLFVIIRDLFPH